MESLGARRGDASSTRAEEGRRSTHVRATTVSDPSQAEAKERGPEAMDRTALVLDACRGGPPTEDPRLGPLGEGSVDPRDWLQAAWEQFDNDPSTSVT